MPSVWIDSCPEVIVHRDDAPQRLQRKPDRGKGLERSVKHVILWVAIGMLAMLTLRLFPNLYDDFWHDTNARLYAEAGDQQDITPLIPGEKQAIQPPQTVPADLAGAEFMEETPQRADSGLSETAVEATAGDHSVVRQLEIGSSDISSFEHIRLATRYMIHFDFNKSSIPEQYQPLLNSIRNKMLLEENSFLKITGYADSQGDRNYNYRLSLKRADAVRKFFTMRGIGETRLQVAAVGSVGKPEPWLDSIDTRREIRRVEVILFPK
jgi:outer membrane protein OmpA-like peptidoglycan-associated protein